MCSFLATPPLFFQTGNCLLCTGRGFAVARQRFYVSGLHALLREAQEQRSVHRLAENGEETHGGETAGH